MQLLRDDGRGGREIAAIDEVDEDGSGEQERQSPRVCRIGQAMYLSEIPAILFPGAMTR